MNEVELKQCSWSYSVEPYSNIIIPTPLSCGGCVIVGLETITYYNKDHCKPIPLAKVCTPYLYILYSMPLLHTVIVSQYSIPIYSNNTVILYIIIKDHMINFQVAS